MLSLRFVYLASLGFAILLPSAGAPAVTISRNAYNRSKILTSFSLCTGFSRK
jgi:hypothetical protein